MSLYPRLVGFVRPHTTTILVAVAAAAIYAVLDATAYVLLIPFVDALFVSGGAPLAASDNGVQRLLDATVYTWVDLTGDPLAAVITDCFATEPAARPTAEQVRERVVAAWAAEEGGGQDALPAAALEAKVRALAAARGGPVPAAAAGCPGAPALADDAVSARLWCSGSFRGAARCSRASSTTCSPAARASFSSPFAPCLCPPCYHPPCTPNSPAAPPAAAAFDRALRSISSSSSVP